MEAPATTFLKSQRYGFIVMLALVALWGVGHRFYETLMPQFASVFALTGTHLALTDSAYQLVYIIGAIPAALFARSFSYKIAILIGLGCICLGAFTFYPASETRSFAYFLFAVMLMAYGWILLEISTNPLAMTFGAPETAVRRLNIAQTAYPIGSVIGIICARWMMHSDLTLPKEGAPYTIAHPYIVLGLAVLVLAFVVEEAPIPMVAQERIPTLQGVREEFVSIFKRPLFGFALVAQFANIFAMAVAWSVANHLFPIAFPDLSGNDLAKVWVWCLILLGAGRFVSTGLMWVISPARVLELFSAGAVLAALAAVAFGDDLAAFAALAICFFVGPAWPTIFGQAVNGLGARMKLAAAPVTIAGALGAVVARLLEGYSARTVMAIAALSCAVILAYALAVVRRSEAEYAEANQSTYRQKAAQESRFRRIGS